MLHATGEDQNNELKAIKNKSIILQKYLLPGHIQKECDSVHSSIERKIKNKGIDLPSDYVVVTIETRTTA